MALTLESIHQPLNDFFLEHFKADDAGPVIFRFDKFGSVVDDDDFIDDAHPELGTSSVLAREKFSDLVNRTPIDSGDGASVVLSENSIDSAYFYRMLSPSLPLVPAGVDAGTKQAMLDAFNTLKAEAVRTWNQLELESSSGLMLQYKPSLATPETWYDSTETDIWTTQSFTIKDEAPPEAPAPPDRLWRLRPDDAVILEAIQVAEITPPPPDTPAVVGVDRGVEIMRTDRLQMLRQRVSRLNREFAPAERVAPALAAAVRLAPRARLASLTAANVAVIPEPAVTPEPAMLHADFARQFRRLDVRDRLAVNEIVAVTAPTEPVRSNEITVAFDYCLVDIRRPWYIDAFINQSSWYVPSTAKGGLTTTGPPGNLPLLPIGFVAIRNLTIESNWAVEDLTNAESATDFGPFKVSTGIANNKLVHVGLQIVGWILQRMPALPPNDPPA